MALKFNNNNVTTLASAEIIDFAGYSKPTDIDPHDITIYAN